MLLALVMVFSLAACGTGNGSASAGKTTSAPAASSGGSSTVSTSENKDDAPETGAPQVEHFVIGFPEAPVDVPAVKAIKLNTQKVAEAAGGEMKNEVFDFTPEGTVDAVEKMINNGVQGVKITPSSDSIIPTIRNMCEEAGVYFILSMRNIGDDSVRAMCEQSEYFLGCVYEDEYYCGYQLGKALAESLGDSDNKTYALIGTTVGDTTGDERERGLADAAKEFGLTRDDLLSQRRNREIAGTRQLAMYLIREMTQLSTTRIGEVFGGRDHTTVMHACDKVARLEKSDEDTQQALTRLRRTLGNR